VTPFALGLACFPVLIAAILTREHRA